jgi:hypothetical protein
LHYYLTYKLALMGVCRLGKAKQQLDSTQFAQEQQAS